MQVIEAPCPNGTSSDVEPQVSTNTYAQNPSATESKDTSESYSSQTVPLKSSGSSMMNHEDTLEVLLTFSTLKCFTNKKYSKCIMKFQMQQRIIVFVFRILRSCLMRKRR